MILIVLLWILASVITYGWSFGYLQNNLPEISDRDYWSDMRFCMMMSLLGPFALLAFTVTVLVGGHPKKLTFKLL